MQVKDLQQCERSRTFGSHGAGNWLVRNRVCCWYTVYDERCMRVCCYVYIAVCEH